MPSNLSIIDTKPKISSILDSKSKLSTVLDIKPRLDSIPKETIGDFLATELGRGMPMGLLLALTYSETQVINVNP